MEYMEKIESEILGLERSYRNERVGAGFISVLLGLSLAGSFLPMWNEMSPPDGISFQEHIIFFIIWLFLTYRAHQKLMLIKHIKYHQTKERSDRDRNAP